MEVAQPPSGFLLSRYTAPRTQKSDALLQDNLRNAQRVVGYDFDNIDLLAKALTAAHRDGDWASDGNRELADIGRSAYRTCLRFSKTDQGHMFTQQAKAWSTLDSSHNIRTVCLNSAFDLCIAHSPRQSRPLPEKVLRYALWAVIGAVHQDARGDRLPVCHALTSLCTYLGDNSTESPQSNSDVRTLSSTPADASAFPAVHSRATSSVNSGPLPLGIHHDETDAYTDPGSATATETSLATATLPDEESTAMLIDGDHKSLPSAPEQPFSSYTVPEIPSAEGDSKKRSRPQVHKRIDEYIAYQQLLRSGKGSVLPSAPPLCDNMDQISQLTKSVTVRKLLHGPISSIAIIMCKDAVARRRAQSSQPRVPAPTDAPNTSYHYNQINHLMQQDTKDTIRLRWHTYQLYAAVRPTAVTDLDAGFVHADSRAPPAKKRAGNQSNLTVSDAYESIMRHFEPDLAAKPAAEQKRLRGFARGLRKLGVRLALLVQRFGPGVLALMPVSCTSHPLSLADWELCELPVDELVRFLGLVCGGAHPLASLAVAAESVLQFVVGERMGAETRFRFEDVEVAAIEGFVEGSEELLGMLQTV